MFYVLALVFVKKNLHNIIYVKNTTEGINKKLWFSWLLKELFLFQ